MRREFQFEDTSGGSKKEKDYEGDFESANKYEDEKPKQSYQSRGESSYQSRGEATYQSKSKPGGWGDVEAAQKAYKLITMHSLYNF